MEETARQLLAERRERMRRILPQVKILDGIRAQSRNSLKIGKTGRLKRSISIAAVMNAVDAEGREVLTKAGEGYWKDQDRRYFGITEGTASITAMRNRLGRVTYRKVYGSNGVTEYGSSRKQTSGVENKNITIMVI